MDAWGYLASLPPVARPTAARFAVLVPLYTDAAGGIRVILTKRPDDMRTHPGDVVFPGGACENGESAYEAAVREAWEEIRLPEEAVVEVLGGLTPVTARSATKLIVPVVVRVERPVDLVPDPSEVDVIIEPLIDELLEEDRWTTSEYYGHKLWFYEFAEGTLWGATAFMVRELLTYLRDTPGD